MLITPAGCDDFFAGCSKCRDVVCDQFEMRHQATVKVVQLQDERCNAIIIARFLQCFLDIAQEHFLRRITAGEDIERINRGFGLDHIAG